MLFSKVFGCKNNMKRRRLRRWGWGNFMNSCPCGQNPQAMISITNKQKWQ